MAQKVPFSYRPLTQASKRILLSSAPTLTRVCAYAGALDKAHFNYGGPDPWRPNISQSPWEGKMQDSMESYSCPAGSVLIFTESLIHAANDWTNPNNRRCAIFNW